MQYEEIESYIRADRPDIWRRLYPLHGFYKDQITRITAENCVFLACYDEAEQVAREVIAWVETQPDELVSGFDLLSQSHAELKELRRITGRVFTRKANRLRRNLRRVIGLHPEDDEVQQAFDNARTASAKSFIIVPDAEHPERSLSAHDLRQFHLRRSYAVNLAIADGIHDLAVNFLNYVGLFLTLTLPGEYRNCSYEQAKTEIGRRWKRVRRKARDRDILLLGMTALELHEDETPHYHIQLYVSPEHRAWVEEQILDAFPNECDRRDEAIKDIRDVARASRYTTKDHGKPETSLTFIGLRKDIKRRYRGVYEGKDTSALSEWRVSRASQLMKQKTLGGAVLLFLRGFADERLNRLSARHPDFHYAGTDTQRLQTMFLHTLHFRVVKDFRETNTPRVSMISKAPKQGNTASCFGPVPTCLYKNQEGVRAYGLLCECMSSLGQPPPMQARALRHSPPTRSKTMPIFVNKNEIEEIKSICLDIINDKIPHSNTKREKLYYIRNFALFYICYICVLFSYYSIKSYAWYCIISMIISLVFSSYFIYSLCITYKNWSIRANKYMERISLDNLSEATTYMVSDLDHINKLRNSSLPALRFFRASCLKIIERDVNALQLFGSDPRKLGITAILPALLSAIYISTYKNFNFITYFIMIATIISFIFSIFTMIRMSGHNHFDRVIFILDSTIDSLGES